MRVFAVPWPGRVVFASRKSPWTWTGGTPRRLFGGGDFPGPIIASGRILRLGVVGDALVFGHLFAWLGEADDLAGECCDLTASRDFGAFQRQRLKCLERGTVEVLEHEEPAAPVGEIEIADDARDLDPVIGLAGGALVQLFQPRPHVRVLPLRFGREHDGAAAAEVDQLVDHRPEVLEEIDAAPDEQLDVRLVEATGRVEALIFRRQHVRVGRLLEADDAREARLYRLDLRRPQMLAHQYCEAGQQFRPHRLPHQRVVMAPVEYALRVEPRMIRIADVEYVFPRDQHAIEKDGGIELVALRGERVLDRILRDDAFPADDGDAFRVGGADAVEDLVAFRAGAEEDTEVQIVGEGACRADRLDAVDHDAFVVRLDDAQGRRVGVRIEIGTVRMRVDEVRRHDEVAVHRELPEIPDVVSEAAPLGADRCLLQRYGD